MKLGVIKHVRCGEPTYDRTLVWLPDDMTEDAFAATIEDARAEYLAFAERFKNEPPPNDYRPGTSVPYQKYPTLTVAQVEADWAVKRVAWEQWNADRQQAKRTFGDYLAGRNGIKRFWEYDPPFEVECNWGHRHGLRLDYDETSVDG